MIRLLLRLYPRAWRDRYEQELHDLVADTGLDPRTAVDVLRGAGREHRRSLSRAVAGGLTVTLGPAWRHPTGWALTGGLLMTPTLLFVAGSLLAYQLGVGALIPLMDAINVWFTTQPRFVDFALLFAPALALVLAVIPLIRLDLSSAEGGQLVLALRLRGLNLAVAVIATILGALLAWHILAETVLDAGY